MMLTGAFFFCANGVSWGFRGIDKLKLVHRTTLAGGGSSLSGGEVNRPPGGGPRRGCMADPARLRRMGLRLNRPPGGGPCRGCMADPARLRLTGLRLNRPPGGGLLMSGRKERGGMFGRKERGGMSGRKESGGMFGRKESGGVSGRHTAVAGDPAAIRTRDRLLRRQMLYPAELPDLPW